MRCTISLCIRNRVALAKPNAARPNNLHSRSINKPMQSNPQQRLSQNPENTIKYTEYILEASYKTICELRTFSNFSLHSLTKKTRRNLYHAKFVYYWSQDIMIQYDVQEMISDHMPKTRWFKNLKISINITSIYGMDFT